MTRTIIIVALAALAGCAAPLQQPQMPQMRLPQMQVPQMRVPQVQVPQMQVPRPSTATSWPFGMPQAAQVGPDGQPIPVAYTINAFEAAAIPNRVLEQVNLLRAGSGVPPLVLNPQLAAAAAAHSQDMAAQQRAWHFGSDGSSPLDRVRREGFGGRLVGQNISESYENDIATLQAWMQTRDTRDVIMDPEARHLGIAWYQEPTRKIWWTLLTGT